MRKEAEQKAIAVLRGHPCFAAAGEEELARLVRHESTVLREMEKGQTVFPPHGMKRVFGLLLSGGCLVRRGGRIVREAPGGSVFALESLFGAGGEPAEIYVAQSACKALFFSKTAVEELMRADFAVTQGMLAFLTERIEALSTLAAAAGSGSAEAGTAAFLRARQKKGSDEIALPLDFGKLARQIGVSRDALSRAFDRLTAAGAIGLRDGKIVIKDAEKLDQFIIENEE